MKRIKIMHVVRSLATGGMENGVRNLLCGLDPDRFEQCVCTLVPSAEAQPANSVCLGGTGHGFEFQIPALVRTFKRERPDVVHSRNWAAIEAVVAAKLSGVPAVVHSEHGRDLQTLGRQPLRRRVLRRISYGWADEVFCVSQELKQYYCRELAWGADKFKVIPNGVDVEKFRPDDKARAAVRSCIRANPSTLVIGTVGRLDPVKDHLTLFRAAHAALTKGLDLQLIIVGDGIERPSLESALARMPKLAQRTSFAGAVKNVAQWLNGFDVFVLPSLSEGMSNTLLEAMAAGIAPVATAVGGNSEIVENDCSGFLVQPRNPESICACLVRLGSDERSRKWLGENARKRVVTHYSLQRMLTLYAEMYCRLLKPRARRMPALIRA
jgi:sugar transferase (PEP-CTERM/EpsH1 system associated)